MMEHLERLLSISSRDRISVNYEVQQQSYIHPPRLEGELILAKSNNRFVGRTGYVEWPVDEYAFNGLNNAIMKIVRYSPPDIEVEKSMRGNGIGFGLLDKLLDRLIEKSFDMLIISQPDGQKQFYCEVFIKLQESRKITSVRRNVSFKLGPVLEVNI